MRKGKPDKLDTPDSEFKKIDQMLPKKKNQASESRTKDIESVMDFLRNKNLPPEDVRNPPNLMEKLPSVPVTRRTPEDRRTDEDSILNWLRQKKDKKHDTTNDDFKKIDQLLPKKQGQKLKDRASDMEGVLDCKWSIFTKLHIHC